MDFTKLYRRYSTDVFRFALYLSGDHAQAEDITAETFARAWVARGQIRVGTVKAYLFMIARNFYRDQMKKRPGALVESTSELEDSAADPECATQAKRELEVVLDGLRQLPELDRSILILATIEGLPHEDVARALGLSLAAVKVRVHRARLKLQELRARKES